VAYILALFIAALSFGAAHAEGPLACDPREAYEICTLKIQRNNALDEAVQIEAVRRRLVDQIDALAAYWRDYLVGLEAQRKLAAAGVESRVARAAEAAKGKAR
jgi:hypothetical protein